MMPSTTNAAYFQVRPNAAGYFLDLTLLVLHLGGDYAFYVARGDGGYEFLVLVIQSPDFRTGVSYSRPQSSPYWGHLYYLPPRQ